jgi:secondary thiamine-phosphate synthase enzyme
MESIEIAVDTGERLITDLTGEAESFCRGKGDGLLHVFAPHATAGLALVELGAGTEDDVAEMVDRLLPPDDRYRHRHGSPGHGRDHVLPAVISPSLTIPVLDGRLAFGTWQSLAFIDPNRDNRRRRVRFSFLG